MKRFVKLLEQLNMDLNDQISITRNIQSATDVLRKQIIFGEVQESPRDGITLDNLAVIKDRTRRLEEAAIEEKTWRKWEEVLAKLEG